MRTLSPWTTDRSEPERPDPVRPDPEVHQGDDLHLHVDDQERGRDAHQQDGRRGDDEPDDQQVRGQEVEDRLRRAATITDDQPDGQDASRIGTTVKMTFPGSVSRAPGRLTASWPQPARHLSTPPMIGSRQAMTAIVSAIRWPGISTPTAWRWMNDGSWIRIRNGWSVPSLIDVGRVLAARALDRGVGPARARAGAAAAAWP